MPIPLPRARLRRILSNPALYDFPVALGGGLTSLAASARFFHDGLPGWAWGTLVVGVALLIAGAIRASLQFAKNDRAEELHELHGCLLTLYHMLCGVVDCRAGHVRITVHVAERSGTRLVQALDYVGDDRGGQTAGRRFPVQSGITGRSFREGAMLSARRNGATQEAYVAELIKNWHYTEADARRVNAWTQSWFAVPIHDGAAGPVIGVLYLDSTDPKFFDAANVLTLVGQAAVGIAFFVGRRYTAR